MRNASVFHAPLAPLDSEEKTVGCRHTNPDICVRNLLPGVCAFAREDGFCERPPVSWKKQYRKLKEEG
jgi:hypothetical protein